MTPPPEIIDLVQRFDRNIDAYRADPYNEAQVRQIDQLVYELYGLTEEEIRIGEEDQQKEGG